MSTLMIEMSDERWRELQELAARLGVSPEELARRSVEEMLARPDEAFEDAADYVLQKNAQLYQRLA